MTRRGSVVIALVALAAVASAAVGSTLVGLDDAEARVSNRGTPTTPNEHDRRLLERSGFKKEIHVLKTRLGKHFARVEKADGTACFATSVRPERTLLGVVLCNPKFPTQSPVLDFSVYGAERGAEMRLIRALGIVTDEVAEVRLVSASGAVVRTLPVEDNVFALDEPGVEESTAHSVVAVDDDGKVVARLGP